MRKRFEGIEILIGTLIMIGIFIYVIFNGYPF